MKKYNVAKLSASTHTANDAIVAIGCQVGQIIKSILLVTHNTQKLILVLATEVNRIYEAIRVN